VRLLIQRIKEASVFIDNKCFSSIKNGLLVFFAAKVGDTIEHVPSLAQKLINLRIFRDHEDKMNLSIQDVGGEILVVSQFTLYGDTSSGRRPSFILSAKGEDAIVLYDAFVSELKKQIPKVETGVFGAKMEVHLINDGPVTFSMDL
jgi:D-aminoacyl-tRNA deacylase